MDKNLIDDYISKLRKKDIVKFANIYNINLDNNELDIIYNIVKNDYKIFIYDNPKVVLDKIKINIKEDNYNKIENIYEKYKFYLKNI